MEHPVAVAFPTVTGPDEAILHELQAGRTAAALERIDATWSDELLGDEPKILEYVLDSIVDLASELLPVYAERYTAERYGRESLAKTLEGPLDADAVAARWRDALRTALGGDTGTELAAAIEKQAVDMLFFRLFDERKTKSLLLDGDEYRAERAKHHGSLLRTSIATHALQVARHNVEQVLERGGTVLEVARRLLLVPEADTTSLVVATSSFALALQRGIMHDLDRPKDQRVNVTNDGRRKHLKVRTTANLESLRAKNRDDVLASMYRRLRDIKRDGAAALKLHLDLMDQAWNAGGDLPIFEYRFSDALNRQGYAKHASRRAFDAGTMRDFRERLALLRSYTVQSWVEKAEGRLEQEIVATPYWIVEGFHYTVQESLGLDLDADVYPVVMREKSAPLYHAVTIRPGLWWKLTDMSKYRLDLPRAVLELPTNYERDRIAMLLAIYLAFHVRRNHQKHAGTSVLLKVGTLLKEADITTREAFMEERPTVAKRLREYLDDLEDGGALPTLRRLGAFNVTIQDEREYLATGRGWRERFWNARLAIEVPLLGIEREHKKA